MSEHGFFRRGVALEIGKASSEIAREGLFDDDVLPSFQCAEREVTPET
jgi:hypothetical protein